MLREKFLTIQSTLNSSFIGRENEVRGLVLSLLSGEHAFLLGPPGTGKSALINALTQMVGASFFPWLMNQFTTPEDVLGPPSFTGLQQDRYERVFTGKLPEAEVAFLDEIWKASVVHNTLLTILNERKVHNGSGAQAIPLHSMFCASNELPAAGQGLEAIYDRILFRYFVRELSADEMVTLLCSPVPGSFSQVVSMDEVKAALVEVKAVPFTPPVATLLGEVRKGLEQAGLEASTRRFIQAVKALQAAAWLDGEVEVTSDSFGILSDILWRKPEERASVVEVVNRIAAPTRLMVQEVVDALVAEKQALSGVPRADKVRYMTAVSDVLDHLREGMKTVRGFGESKAAVKVGLATLQTMEQEVTKDLLAATTARRGVGF